MRFLGAMNPDDFLTKKCANVCRMMPPLKIEEMLHVQVVITRRSEHVLEKGGRDFALSLRKEYLTSELLQFWFDKGK
jgi:hypothetical protein